MTTRMVEDDVGPPTTTRLRGALWITTGTLVVLIPDLGTRILSNNDEARFPLLARDVLLGGDWLHPRVNGALYANKPVLLAWLIALVSWPAGAVTHVTAVLPSAVAGLATVLLVYGFGRDLLGEDAGRLAALVAMTTQGLFVHARLPLPDMLMTCFITGSTWMLAKMVRGDRGPSWLGFYGLAGVAFWSKGPAGLLPLAIALVHRVLTGRSERRPSLHAVPGVTLVGAMVALWWLSAAHANQAAAREAVLVDQLQWYRPHLSASALVAPVRNLFGILFPWVLALPMVLAHAVRFLRGRGAERDRVLFLVAWAASTFVLIALSREQRFRYYLPVVPPVALLTGWWAAGVVVKGRHVERLPWQVYLLLALLAALPTAVLVVSRGGLPELPLEIPTSPVEALVAVVALAAIVAALWWGARSGRLDKAVVVGSAASALFLIVTYHGEIQRRNVSYDYGRVAASVRGELKDERVVAAWGVAALPLAFYLEQPVVVVESDAGLREAATSGQRVLIVFSDAALARSKEREHLTVLARDRLGTQPIALVRYGPPGGGDARRAWM